MPGALPADGPGNALWAPMPPAVPPLRPSWPQFVSSCSALSVHPSSAPSPSLGLRGLGGFLVPPPPPSQGLEHFHPFLRGPVNLGHGRICSKGETLLPNQATWLINASIQSRRSISPRAGGGFVTTGKGGRGEDARASPSSLGPRLPGL